MFIYLEMINLEYWVFLLQAGGSWQGIEFEKPQVPTRTGLASMGLYNTRGRAPRKRGVVYVIVAQSYLVLALLVSGVCSYLAKQRVGGGEELENYASNSFF